MSHATRHALASLVVSHDTLDALDEIAAMISDTHDALDLDLDIVLDLGDALDLDLDLDVYMVAFDDLDEVS